MGNGQVPHHTAESCCFATVNRAPNHSRCGDSCMCWCESDSTGPLDGDQMANGRVEMTVREVKRQISAEQNTSVRIADHSPLLSWLPSFCSPSHELKENSVQIEK